MTHRRDYFERSRDLMADPSSSFFLQIVIHTMDLRDPLAALRDIEIAYGLACQRWAEAQQAAEAQPPLRRSTGESAAADPAT